MDNINPSPTTNYLNPAEIGPNLWKPLASSFDVDQ